ncbi:MAG: hypothetical protein JWO22_4094, partial [Frankiales bacterium]|nr:hypothetical protein [Frankiales bacterium]
MSIVSTVRARAGRAGQVGFVAGALLCLSGGGLAQASPTLPSLPVPITMTVSGHITEADTGQAIAGMCVLVDALSTSGTVATATSASDGSYVASWRQNQDTSRYSFGVRTTAACGAAGRWLDTPYFAQVTLVPQQGKSAASGIDGRTARAGRILGTITDDGTGRPVSGVSVSWTYTGPSSPPTTAAPKVTTAADGTFVLGG